MARWFFELIRLSEEGEEGLLHCDLKRGNIGRGPTWIDPQPHSGALEFDLAYLAWNTARTSCGTERECLERVVRVSRSSDVDEQRLREWWRRLGAFWVGSEQLYPLLQEILY